MPGGGQKAKVYVWCEEGRPASTFPSRPAPSFPLSLSPRSVVRSHLAVRLDTHLDEESVTYSSSKDEDTASGASSFRDHLRYRQSKILDAGLNLKWQSLSSHL